MFYTQQSRQSRAFREEFGNALQAVTCALVYVCMAVFEAWSKCETMLYMPWLDDVMCTPGHLARTVCVQVGGPQVVPFVKVDCLQIGEYQGQYRTSRGDGSIPLTCMITQRSMDVRVCAWVCQFDTPIIFSFAYAQTILPVPNCEEEGAGGPVKAEINRKLCAMHDVSSVLGGEPCVCMDVW